ncbi:MULTISPECIES: zinc-binding dehydrogenase [unclassified Meiothermus]|uniref:zinc-binding dehydrogenase n=1 Tax=unclassified Meiothermus TaxID=370471 RepID=UPI000D7CF651|nr:MULTISPECIES: zinc-binding dehydrogenase [unclassified Meiothermus]PZA07258.1 oxidoreductase [Meiothermus sp. Pnk-1]RYM37992.1 oxidoreductase [Meiothermus sp. PNK-Is4]
MGIQVVFTAPRTVQLQEYPDPPLQPGEVRVRTLYSGISAGTELTQYRGTNPYLEKRWDPERRLFVPGQAGLEYPLRGIGYEQVGQVVEVGSQVRRLEVGQVVWGSWGHRSSAVLSEEVTAPRRLRGESWDPRIGIFARIGAIALNMVHDAEVRLGDTVAVFGLGVVGILAAQLARLNGAEVVAVDGIKQRLELARKLGLQTIDFRQENPAEAIKALTHNRGADASLEATGSYTALHEAIRATAYNSKVVVGGFFQGEGTGLRLGEEFHHNRIQLICSQTSGVHPGLDHRWDRLRLEQTVMRLAVEEKLELRALVSHVFPALEAARAYELLDQQPAEAVQVMLDFQEVA